MAAVTFRKAPGGRWAVIADGVRIGTVWNNGARRAYHRSWSAKAGPGAPETKHSTRQDAGESLARQVAAAARLEHEG